MPVLWKYLITAALVVAVSEVAQRTGYLGGLIASLPLVSYLAMIWLYVEKQDKQQVADLSFGVFWFVLPTLPFFLLLPWLLKHLPFAASMAIATVALFACYAFTVWVLRKNGIELA